MIKIVEGINDWINDWIDEGINDWIDERIEDWFAICTSAAWSIADGGVTVYIGFSALGGQRGEFEAPVGRATSVLTDHKGYTPKRSR